MISYNFDDEASVYSLGRQVINKELAALPTQDFLALTDAMKGYQLDSGVGYRVENYGNDLWMITDSGSGQGRGLFFAIERTEEMEVLVVLRVYKKESRKAPPQEITLAQTRSEAYRRKMK